MKVLRPYIEKGQLDVRSKQTKMNQVTTLRWDGGTAQKRMDDLLSKNYGSEEVDAVLSPYDGISIGILSALKSAGYGTKDKPLPARHRPGRRARLREVHHRGTSRPRPSTRTPANSPSRPCRWATPCSPARSPRSTTPRPTTTARRSCPSYLLKPVSIDKSNTQRLVDDGYYKAGQLK